MSIITDVYWVKIRIIGLDGSDWISDSSVFTFVRIMIFEAIIYFWGSLFLWRFTWFTNWPIKAKSTANSAKLLTLQKLLIVNIWSLHTVQPFVSPSALCNWCFKSTTCVNLSVNSLYWACYLLNLLSLEHRNQAVSNTGFEIHLIHIN